MQYFAPFRFDVDQGLWRGGVALHLTRKASRILGCLLETPGCWVSKADIMRTVWPDTHVQPENVKVLVREIRLALDDDFRKPRFIRSGPGRGYMFVAPVVPAVPPEAPPTHETTRPRVSAFVGRAAELAHLHEAMDSARASCRRIVLVTGPRGIGKSALCSAFLRSLRTSVRVVWRSHVDARHAAVPGETGAIARVSKTAVPAARALLERIEGAHAEAASDQPVVVVLDDLQWADVAFVEAMLALLATECASRLLVIATFAEDPRRRTASALRRLGDAAGRYPGVSMIELAPLGAFQVARYLEVRFGGLATTCVSELHRATCGNPGLMVAAADDLGARIHGRVRPPVADGSKPFSVHLARALARAIRRRLALLDGADRQLLEAATGVGMEFAPDAVAARLGRDAGSIDRALDRLAVREHLIARSGSPLGRPKYQFVHPLHAQLLMERAAVARQIRSVRECERWSERQRCLA